MESDAKVAWERYRNEHPIFVAAAQQMKAELSSLARQRGLRVDVDARAKDVSSFAKKLRSKGYARPWEQVTDKVGARVIVESLSDLERMIEAVRTSPLDVKSVEDKSETAQPNELFYPGVHIQVGVPRARDGRGGTIECEVQVRTKAQDLWSVPSHKLTYKSVVDPSRQTVRRIMRLSTLVELFDEEVAQAMKEVESMPVYASARLLRLAEGKFLTFVGEPGDDDLSLESLSIVANAIPTSELPDYDATMNSFTTENYDRLRELYDRYGPGGSAGDDWDNWLMSQPESLIIFERIANRQRLLRSVVEGTEVESAVRFLYDLWGTPYDAG
jgi:ppGpp synthetase/RelA/SpoT-type nucleotidyltranferase